MRIALKYGLLITLVVAVWIVVVRLWIGIGSDSKLNIIAPILFNLTAILSTYAGIKEWQRQRGEGFSFKQGLKTGMAISLVYAISACLFFVAEYLVSGPKLLQGEFGPSNLSFRQMALRAYGGLFFGSLFFGLIYSTMIAFLLARRRPK